MDLLLLARDRDLPSLRCISTLENLNEINPHNAIWKEKEGIKMKPAEKYFIA
jgi:hypothetical protein